MNFISSKMNPMQEFKHEKGFVKLPLSRSNLLLFEELMVAAVGSIVNDEREVEKMTCFLREEVPWRRRAVISLR